MFHGTPLSVRRAATTRAVKSSGAEAARQGRCFIMNLALTQKVPGPLLRGQALIGGASSGAKILLRGGHARTGLDLNTDIAH